MSVLTDDPGVLTARIARIRVQLAHGASIAVDNVDLKVAASLTHLGLTGRLVAAWVALLAVAEVSPQMRLSSLWWQDTTGGAYPLSVALPVPMPDPTAAPMLGIVPEPDAQARRFLSDALEPLTQALLAVVPVPSSVLWGNVASALNSSTQVLAASPDRAARVAPITAAVMAHPRLAGERAQLGPGFRRTSCCLLTRLTRPALEAVCGDCGRHER